MKEPIIITVPMSINRKITPNASRAIKPVWKSSIHSRMKQKAIKATEALSLSPFSDDDLPITIHILWAREKNRKIMDQDNLIASVKWFLDGIAKAIDVNDRNFIIGTVTQERDTTEKAKGYVRFVLESANA